MTVLITGASRGIGRACAERFARKGDNLRLICRENIERLREDAGRLSAEYGISCEAYRCDVGDAEAVRELTASFPAPDILVNNAGIAYYGLVTEMPYENWRRLMATDLDSLFLMSRAVIPGMLKKGGGKIINISSVWGVAGASCEAAYSAAKAGVHGFTKALAKELAPSGIPVNAIAGGVIDTDMNRDMFDEEELDALREEIPAGRFGEPDEVADMVCLLSEAPTYLTGQIIAFDGGWI